jgi:hypothetical protein
VPFRASSAAPQPLGPGITRRHHCATRGTEPRNPRQPCRPPRLGGGVVAARRALLPRTPVACGGWTEAEVNYRQEQDTAGQSGGPQAQRPAHQDLAVHGWWIRYAARGHQAVARRVRGGGYAAPARCTLPDPARHSGTGTAYISNRCVQ